MENVVLILGLVSGEHLIATVEERQGAYLCSNVLQIVTDPDVNTGQVRMGLMPYMPYADPDSGFAVPTNMAIMAVPSEDLLNHYNERFAKIITPSTKIIV